MKQMIAYLVLVFAAVAVFHLYKKARSLANEFHPYGGVTLDGLTILAAVSAAAIIR